MKTFICLLVSLAAVSAADIGGYRGGSGYGGGSFPGPPAWPPQGAYYKISERPGKSGPWAPPPSWPGVKSGWSPSAPAFGGKSGWSQVGSSSLGGKSAWPAPPSFSSNSGWAQGSSGGKPGWGNEAGLAGVGPY